jgi:hypothetical protein
VKDVDTRNGAGVPGIRAHLLQSLRIWRRRLLWQRFLHTLATLGVLALTGYLLSAPASTIMQLGVVLALVFFLQLPLSPAWRRSRPGNFVEHLNRCFPDFEESARLLLAGDDQLTPLQTLQRERVVRVYSQNMARVERWRNPIRYRAAVGVIAACILLGLFSQEVVSLATRFISVEPGVSARRPTDEQTPGLTVISVNIEPPAYMGLEATQTRTLDLEFPEGSRIEWVLDIDSGDRRHALQLSGGEQLPLNRGDDGHLHASAVIRSTDLYRIVDTGAGDERTIGGIHSLDVGRDRPPDIRIIEPRSATLEIPKSGPTRFTSKTLARDDFGLHSVAILASVAKGSGEGVKFRDQKLEFDQVSGTAGSGTYEKDWDLAALGMEPGDEVYFTVIATDNRQPEANTGRSETVIVRWLDDEETGLAADGPGIDFMPEYFKSQRQIIIETEQLLEDRPQLAAQHFKQTSYEIGHAQADLKEKYGQYLGDEFGEGPGEQLGGTHEPASPAGEDHDHQEAAHETDIKSNLNSTADILRLYGHNHGDPEIGPITRRNPVALMKRAVSEMWQAERHLMQAEPDLALPFEYEAYKYLKLARQADRIYVKRLGFEPPPVSEDNRLKGKLDEIASYRTTAPEAQSKITKDPSGQLLLKTVYQLLKKYSLSFELNESERELLHQLSRDFTLRSQSGAALIRHAASLEKLALGGRLDADSCNACLADLESAIWNLIDNGDAQFHYRRAAWFDDDELVDAYIQARENIGAPVGAGDAR